MDTPAARPHWQTIDVAGHPCEMYVPPDAVGGRAILFLHGGGEPGCAPPWLQDLAALRDPLEAARLPVLAPRTGHSWWIDRVVPAFDPAITPERFVVDAVRGEFARRFGVTPPGIALLGMHMGGQGALRLAYRYPHLFPVAAALAPALDFHLAMRDPDAYDDSDAYAALWPIYGDVERARQDTAILHVHPLNWPRHQCFVSDPSDWRWHDGAARLREKLVALGIPHTALLEPRSDPAGDALRFVTTALDTESRRLPAPS
jgi:hypothetical protein